MKRKFNFFIVTALVVFFAMAADAFIIYQLGNYETRFLEIYGTQQDGYVEVVLGQINRLGSQGTKEDITEIVGSLDATASKYWTVSKDGSLLFVKSVAETNRYQGFTDGAYYAGSSASEFMDSLGVGQVGHKVIELAGGRFVASGMVFEWQGGEYKICLLTYDRAILEDNILLECKNSIIIILSLVLVLLIVLSMAMSRKISRQGMEISKQEGRMVWQNQQIERLDGQLKRENAFSARKHVFQNSVLDEFLEVLDEKGARPLHFAVFETESQQARDEFFERMQVMLDNHVLRFSMDGGQVLLIFVGYEEHASQRIIGALENWNVHGVANLYCEDNTEGYQAQFHTFWEAAAGQ